MKSEMEFELTEEDYESESTCNEKGDKISTIHSTLNSLNLDLPFEESVIVRCKTDDGSTTDAYMINVGQGIYVMQFF